MGIIDREWKQIISNEIICIPTSVGVNDGRFPSQEESHPFRRKHRISRILAFIYLGGLVCQGRVRCRHVRSEFRLHRRRSQNRLAHCRDAAARVEARGPRAEKKSERERKREGKEKQEGKEEIKTARKEGRRKETRRNQREEDGGFNRASERVRERAPEAEAEAARTGAGRKGGEERRGEERRAKGGAGADGRARPRSVPAGVKNVANQIEGRGGRRGQDPVGIRARGRRRRAPNAASLGWSSDT
ncbi:hypothetical protein MARPO_0067s0071, partial [Marchantia polymorpha]